MAQANCVAIYRDVDSILDHLDEQAKCLSLKHARSVACFQHQFYQGGHMVRQKRAVSVFNAARQIEWLFGGMKGWYVWYGQKKGFSLTHSL